MLIYLRYILYIGFLQLTNFPKNNSSNACSRAAFIIRIQFFIIQFNIRIKLGFFFYNFCKLR